jgi:hypothetical protein
MPAATSSSSLCRATLTLIAAACTLIPSRLGAQILDLGITGGVNMANLDARNFEETNSITRIAAGISLTLGTGSGLALQPEILFSQKGASSPFGPGATLHFNIDYVQIPVLAKIRLPLAGIGPALFIGPSAGFNTSCRAKLTSGSAETSNDCSEADLRIENLDLSVVGGVGLDVGALSVFVRYEHGLSDVTQEEASEAMNRVWFLGLRLSLLRL